MKIFRYWLAMPLYLAQLTVTVAMWLVMFVTRQLQNGCDLVGRHVYYPICVWRRIVSGEPRWRVLDFNLGISPTRKEDREIALAAGYVAYSCQCGKPDCKRPEFWMPKALGEPVTVGPDDVSPAP